MQQYKKENEARGSTQPQTRAVQPQTQAQPVQPPALPAEKLKEPFLMQPFTKDEPQNPLAKHYTFTMPSDGTVSFTVSTTISISVRDPRYTGVEFWLNGKREAVIGYGHRDEERAGITDKFTKEYTLSAGEH
jgi:hypothetical protein